MTGLLKIAVCDDEREVVDNISRLVSQIFAEKGEEITVSGFLSGEELLCGGRYDLIFLDIEMRGIDGIKAAQRLRERDLNAEIVYVTSYEKYALESFAAHPFDFVVKPITKDKLTAVINDFLASRRGGRRASPVIELKSVDGILSLELNSIYAFETSGNRRVTVYTEDKKFKVKGGLKEIYSLVDPNRFICPHKSFIINPDYVKSIVNCDIYMSNGLTVPIAQHKLKAFRERFGKYIENYIRQA